MQQIKSNEMTIFDHIASEKFRSKLRDKILRISKIRHEAGMVKGKLKRHPVDYLIDINAFDSYGISDLLPDIINKKSTLPASVRQFINELTYDPLIETISEYMQREQLEKKNEPETIEA